jgi:hypothetical protein
MATETLRWTKSSYSDFEDAACVEIAITPAAVLVRDSKNTHGPHLTLRPAAWADFLTASADVRTG